MKAKMIRVDDSVNLVVQEDGEFGVVWAGCYYGPAKKLEELAEGQLLLDARAALEKTDGWIEGRLVNPDDGLGERFLADWKDGMETLTIESRDRR